MIQVGPITDCSLQALKEDLSDKFPWFRITEIAPVLDHAEAYDSLRDQYHSTRILVSLEKQIQTLDVQKLLGLASVDIFIPGMDFVFGEARLPGRVGIVSTYRLKPQRKENRRLLDERVLKTATHEVGHMLGLKHCENTLCIMHFSEQISDTDRKKTEFCESCKNELEMIRID